MLLLLGGWGEQIGCQFFILLHALRQRMPAVHAHPILIILPNRCGRRSGHVGSHNEFDWKWFAFLHDAHIRMRDGNQVIGDDRLGLFEPECAGEVEHGALERDEGQLPVESRLPVGGDQRDDARLRFDLVPVSHLAPLAIRQPELVARDLRSVVVRQGDVAAVQGRLGLQLRVEDQVGLLLFHGNSFQRRDQIGGARQAAELGDRPRAVGSEGGRLGRRGVQHDQRHGLAFLLDNGGDRIAWRAQQNQESCPRRNVHQHPFQRSAGRSARHIANPELLQQHLRDALHQLCGCFRRNQEDHSRRHRQAHLLLAMVSLVVLWFRLVLVVRHLMRWWIVAEAR
mmetsp:Transcript_9507/g.27113  ORF Transcript_9507/g.27113 Transcript_9507/m.27113 type:complete len:340 (+) Transcript_9507:422-1441(+)